MLALSNKHHTFQKILFLLINQFKFITFTTKYYLTEYFLLVLTIQCYILDKVHVLYNRDFLIRTKLSCQKITFINLF